MIKKILLVVISSLLFGIGLVYATTTLQENQIILSKADLVKIETAITNLRDSLDKAREEADSWHQEYNDLATCVMSQAKLQQPAMECLGDKTI